MIALAIIGLIILPILFNLGYVYLCFKKENKGRRTTVEGFVRYLNDPMTFLLLMPVFSHIMMLTFIIMVLTYPLQVVVKRWYNRVKDKEI